MDTWSLKTSSEHLANVNVSLKKPQNGNRTSEISEPKHQLLVNEIKFWIFH